MNSSSNVKKAIEYEINRQIELLEQGEVVTHETRSYNATSSKTISMRHKEEANDYRYFPEPDLPPIKITEQYIKEIKKTLPPLPKQLFKKFTSEFCLSDYDTNILIEEKEIALYFLEITKYNKNYKLIANMIIGPIKAYLNEYAININDLKTSPKNISNLINLIDEGKVSNSVATSKIFPIMIQTNLTPIEIAKNNNWIQDSDMKSLLEFIKQSISKYPEKVDEYKSGKKGLIGLFMGEVMKLSKGKADPKIANQLLKNELEK